MRSQTDATMYDLASRASSPRASRAGSGRGSPSGGGGGGDDDRSVGSASTFGARPTFSSAGPTQAAAAPSGPGAWTQPWAKTVYTPAPRRGGAGAGGGAAPRSGLTHVSDGDEDEVRASAATKSVCVGGVVWGV